jgi:pilus assembly protein CpaC
MEIKMVNKSIVRQSVRLSAAIVVCGILGTANAAEPAATPAPTTSTQAVVANAAAEVSFTPAPDQGGEVIDTGLKNGKLNMAVNKTAVITTKEKYKRFSVGQPDIADVTAVGPTTLLVTGKKYGTTQIIVWDELEKSQVIDVSVEFDVQALRDEFKRLFPDAPIEVEVVNGQVTLKGRVANLKVAEQAAKVASAYSEKVINFLEIGGGQQIVLHVQFIEMSRAASTELGFRSFFTDGNSTIGTLNGAGATPIGALAQGADNAIGSGVTLFGSGNIGGMAFEAFLSALKTNSLARTLAEPNLVAISGEDAEFLAGGEIPIPVPQSGTGGGSTITIEYKEFGVRLKYNAVVLGDGRIRLKVAPEVSELDTANAVLIPGTNTPVPGIRTRKVNSLVEMGEGQTLALAGLLQRRVDAQNSHTPLLGDLPIIGAMFRTVKYQRSETELVILVTPRLAQAMNPDQVPALPGDNWRHPNEAQLWAFGDLGGPQASKTGKDGDKVAASPPRFIGPTGFDENAAPLQPQVATVDGND